MQTQMAAVITATETILTSAFFFAEKVGVSVGAEALKNLMLHIQEYMALESSREEHYETKDMNISRNTYFGSPHA